MKELEYSQDFSHYKSRGIFPDAQGQLTPQSLVRSGRISNSSEMLYMSSLPASMKKIRSKIEALECSQHYTSIFRRARADNSGVGGGIWLKFDLIQALMHVLVTYKNADDSYKNKGARVVTTFFPLKVYGDFSRRPRAANSAVLGRIWPKFEILWLSSLPVSMKIRPKKKALACSQRFPNYNPMGAIRCHGHQSSDPIWSKI